MQVRTDSRAGHRVHGMRLLAQLGCRSKHLHAHASDRICVRSLTLQVLRVRPLATKARRVGKHALRRSGMRVQVLRYSGVRASATRVAVYVRALALPGIGGRVDGLRESQNASKRRRMARRAKERSGASIPARACTTLPRTESARRASRRTCTVSYCEHAKCEWTYSATWQEQQGLHSKLPHAWKCSHTNARARMKTPIDPPGEKDAEDATRQLGQVHDLMMGVVGPESASECLHLK